MERLYLEGWLQGAKKRFMVRGDRWTLDQGDWPRGQTAATPDLWNRKPFLGVSGVQERKESDESPPALIV